MISIPPKPQPRTVQSLHPWHPQRLPKWRSMSINLGRLCQNGAAIFADTYSYLDDGSARRDHKIFRFNGKDIAFIIADASNDADAAKTLANRIATHLRPAKKWKDVEKVVFADMAKWRKAYSPDTPPRTVFTAAIMLKGDKPELGLFTLEPPQTFIAHHDGYIAHGIACDRANSIYDLLFSPHPQLDRQAVLRESAYILSRVKAGNVFCRGIDAYFLDSKTQTTRHIDLRDIEAAIKASFQLDGVLWMASLATLQPKGKYFDHNVQAVGHLITDSDQLRDVIFHDVTGEIL